LPFRNFQGQIVDRRLTYPRIRIGHMLDRDRPPEVSATLCSTPKTS
jgi:hypothetical protein